MITVRSVIYCYRMTVNGTMCTEFRQGLLCYSGDSDLVSYEGVSTDVAVDVLIELH